MKNIIFKTNNSRVDRDNSRIIVGENGGIRWDFSDCIAPDSTMERGEKIVRNQPAPDWIIEGLNNGKAIVIQRTEILRDRGIFCKIIGRIADVTTAEEILPNDYGFFFDSKGKKLYRSYTPKTKISRMVDGQIITSSISQDEVVMEELVGVDENFYAKSFSNDIIEDAPELSTRLDLDFQWANNEPIGASYKLVELNQKRFYYIKKESEKYNTLQNVGYYSDRKKEYAFYNKDAAKTGIIQFFAPDEINDLSESKACYAADKKDLTESVVKSGVVENFRIEKSWKRKSSQKLDHYSNDGMRAEWYDTSTTSYFVKFTIDGVEHSASTYR